MKNTPDPRSQVSPREATSPPYGPLSRLARRFVTGRLNNFRRGEITIEDGQGRLRLGEGDDLRTRVRVNHPRFYREAALGGSLSLASSWIRGDWDCEDLTALFRIVVRNIDESDRMDRGLSRVLTLGAKLYHWLSDNTRTGSRKNIGAHYDLGNEFFQLWLDPTLAYSSGIFPNASASLEDASIEKFDRVCRKLELRQTDHLLEIGTGWGGLAIHAAERYGCRITTTTISERQFELARRRIHEAGLNDRITLLKSDYRDLSGQFDKLVSIEMVEAVGHAHFDQYFQTCGRLLKPSGTFLLQGIVMPERRYACYLKSVDFIQRYVFPGGCLPSVAAMLESSGRSTDLRVVHLEDFAPHYAETLRRWRSAFHDQLAAVRRLGCSEEFIRLWTYYLCYCEAVFEERYVGVVQICFDKPHCRRDPLRIGERAPRAGRDAACDLPRHASDPARFAPANE